MYSKIIEYIFKELNHNDIIYFDLINLNMLIKSKTIGILKLLEDNKNIKCSDELINIMSKINRINYIRNINLLNNSLFVDCLLKEYKIKRVWLKGIVDIYNNPNLLNILRLNDCDLLVDNVEFTRDILFKHNFNYGGLSKKGTWLTLDEDEIQKIEEEHYELFPVTRIIELPFIYWDLEDQILNTLGIFRNNNLCYTGFSLDIHHSLTIGLKPMWMLKNEADFPVSQPLDDLWYLINKTYYEVIVGNSIDLQLLFKTIFKIKKGKYDKNTIINRMKDKEINFLNEDAINCIFNLSDEEVDICIIDKYLNKLVTRISNFINCS